MRILFTPYGGGSIAHIIRSLAVADELKSRGHEILFTAPVTKKNLILNAGYPVFGEGHPEVNLNDQEDQSIEYFKKNQTLFLEWLKDEQNAVEYFQPNIIVNSPNFFGNLTGAKYDIPYISIINSQWLTEFKGLLGLGKSGDKMSHKLLRALAKPIFVKRFESVYMPEISHFHRELNMPTIPIKRNELHLNPAIIPGIPDFEPLELHNRDNLHFVGPLFWQGFEKDEFIPENIFEDFSNKPFVYVSLGGSIYRKKSYEELAQALANHRNWNSLLSLGPNFDRNDFISDQPHFVIRPFVPGLKACQYADAIVNTGSHGTVMQALWHGKPIIALPHNIDQGTIASRITELGVGHNLNPIGIRDFSNREKYFEKATQVPWRKIIKVTEKVLADKKLIKRAGIFKDKLRKYDKGEKEAADLIEHYAKK